MFTDFKSLAESLPSGLVITDDNLDIEFINDFALSKLFSFKGSHPPANFRDFSFHTTDMRRFDMDNCMKSIINSGKRIFSKSLFAGSAYDQKLVYFAVNTLTDNSGKAWYLFNITNISDEVDCITHATGIAGKEEFQIRKKIIGNEEKIRDIYRLLGLAAQSDVNVLIQGESGTGKELAADAIHEQSVRKKKPFIKVNCSAFPETLLESELFGHVKGAFTGAYKDKPGKFELADGGTIFLDEIGDISQAIQVKLLRVIQEKTIERVGDNKPIKVDMRIITATNRNLRELISKNIFREDLFYRLNVFNIIMPPLRERHLDIPLLIDFFIEKYNKNYGKNVKSVSREAMKRLLDYPWPGNIRELQNAIEHAFVLVAGHLIELNDLPLDVVTGQSLPANLLPTLYGQPTSNSEYNNTIKKNLKGRLNISREQLVGVLEKNGFNQSRTAESLGISRVALWKKLKKLGISH